MPTSFDKRVQLNLSNNLSFGCISSCGLSNKCLKGMFLEKVGNHYLLCFQSCNNNIQLILEVIHVLGDRLIRPKSHGIGRVVRKVPSPNVFEIRIKCAFFQK